MCRLNSKRIIAQLLLMCSTLICNLHAHAEYTYQPDANPATTLTTALEQAKKNNNMVLIVFGSEWCPDCRSLNKKMTEAPLSETIKQSFTVMHVDIGNWDKNMDFTKQFGEPVSKGIPSIAILDSDKNIKYVSLGGDLATARSSKTTSLDTWFKNVVADISTDKK